MTDTERIINDELGGRRQMATAVGNNLGNGRDTEKGLPEGVSESARQFHTTLTKIGYGLGRPRIQGMDLIYNTPNPEDARTIAQDVSQIASSAGVNATGRADGNKLIVTLAKGYAGRRSFTGFLRAVKSGNVSAIEKQGGQFLQFTKGENELSGAAGGYLVPKEYSTALLRPLAERAIIYPRATVIPMASSEIQCPMLDATSVQAAGTSPFFAGLLFKWGVDGTSTFTNDETEPAFREMTLRAWDLLGYGSVTNQWLQDTGPEGDARLLDIFGQAAAWYAEAAFFSGVGAGGRMPQGFLNATAAYLYSRAGANHVAQADVAGMMGRLLPSGWLNSIWCCSPSALTDVAKVTGYQANMMRRDDQDPCVGYLGNRPLYATDKLPALGTVGDLVLLDPSLYAIGDRMQVVVDVSDQTPTLFQSNRSMFRIWLRCDGRSILNDVVTLSDAAATVVSSIVVLN